MEDGPDPTPPGPRTHPLRPTFLPATVAGGLLMAGGLWEAFESLRILVDGAGWLFGGPTQMEGTLQLYAVQTVLSPLLRLAAATAVLAYAWAVRRAEASGESPLRRAFQIVWLTRAVQYVSLLGLGVAWLLLINQP